MKSGCLQRQRQLQLQVKWNEIEKHALPSTMGYRLCVQSRIHFLYRLPLGWWLVCDKTRGVGGILTWNAIAGWTRWEQWVEKRKGAPSTKSIQQFFSKAQTRSSVAKRDWGRFPPAFSSIFYALFLWCVLASRSLLSLSLCQGLATFG